MVNIFRPLSAMVVIMQIALQTHSTLADTYPEWSVSSFLRTGYQNNGGIPVKKPRVIAPFGEKRDAVSNIAFDGKLLLVGYFDRFCIESPETGETIKSILCNAMNISPMGNYLGVLRISDKETYTIVKVSPDYSIAELGTIEGIAGGYLADLLYLCEEPQKIFLSFNKKHALDNGPGFGMMDIVYGNIGSAAKLFERTWNSWVHFDGNCILINRNIWCVADGNRGIFLFTPGASDPKSLPLQGRPVSLAPFPDGTLCEVALIGNSAQMAEITALEPQISETYDNNATTARNKVKELRKLISGLQGAVFCRSIDGSVIWEKRLPTHELLRCPPAMCPDGTAIVPAAQTVYAMRNGHIAWQWRLKKYSQESWISAFSNGVLIASGSSLSAVDNVRGKELWTITTISTVTTRPVADAQGNIFVGTLKGLCKVSTQ